ncbi:GFA family protein [Bradyrhizobium sp. SRL28]|uniref:GFA family protein n=1 Tax=Bradyrhizobium sp. SRL28 TaxID=2836178 RepID=UPI001BDF0B58|nr:GFA family protein [Bradyrhizobium sp. SRL28]MBT1514528.1 GFA family protein [Bradyrhizobium sp. SRL28]
MRRDPYEIASFPLLLYTCNCTDCQRQTGSAFALNMPVRFADFRILKGEPNGWNHTSPNGTAVISRFCGNCGTRLYGERGGRPETISLRAGALDDTSWLVPVAHFLRAARSVGTTSARCGVFRNPAERLGKPAAWMACPLD